VSERPADSAGSSSVASVTRKVGKSTPGSRSRDGLPRGAQLGRYVVLGQAGQGGMGIVYTGYDEELDRKVAIKVLHARNEIASTQGRSRLLQEARAIAQLSHPNIVHVYEVGVFEDKLFLVMEWVPGETLSAWMGKTRSWREVVDVFIQAGRGLAAAHHAGMVHLDFKPANVLLGVDGRVRVLDFGLARPRSPDRKGMGPEVLVVQPKAAGTPPYMAPEQHVQGKIGPAADQFGFCVSLWLGLYGRRPFRSKDLATLQKQKREGDITVSASDRKVPPWLERILRRGLSPDPAARWPSMDALLAALAADPWKRRRKVLGWGAALSGAAAGIFGLTRGVNPCEGAEAQLSGSWDGTRTQAAREGILATQLPYAHATWDVVLPAVDDYANDWTAMYRDACEARHVRGEQSDRLLDLRMTCLQRRRRELSAVVDLFIDADADIVEHAVDAANSLSSVAQCGDVEALALPVPLPEDEEIRSRVDGVRAMLDRAAALRKAGRPNEATALKFEAYEAAMELPYLPLQAEAALAQGAGLRHEGRHEEAREAWLAAAHLAAASHSVHVEARAWSGLMVIVGSDLGRVPEGLAFGEAAMAAVKRLGTSGHLLEAEYQHRRASVLQFAARLPEAEAANNRALELYLEHDGTATQVASAHSALTFTLSELGRYDEAEEHHLKAIASFRDTLGEQHPDIANAQTSYSAMLAIRGRYPEARAILEGALGVLEAAYGPDSVHLASTLHNLAVVTKGMGDEPGALKMLLRILAVQEAGVAPDPLETARSLSNIAELQLSLGEAEAAQRSAERALKLFTTHAVDDLWEAAMPTLALAKMDLARNDYDKALDKARDAKKRFSLLDAKHPYVSYALATEGRILIEMGRNADAADAMEQALTIRRLATDDPGQIGRLQFRLARALVESDPARALSLARQAQSGMAGLERESDGDLLKTIEQWLQEHPAVAP